MVLAPGTRLGPYEISALIGQGGMGMVYRATDTNLKRAVAIKVLPDALAADVERIARFQREAEVLASLNHVNIAHVHGLEKSGGATAIIMELVEGPTLEERIARGPIPLDEALAIARQIADALDAAHKQSIVHRDLKPANIKLRPPGTVKVLDFGLAKGFDAPPASPAQANSPTMTTPAGTVAGMIVGTPAYMAPEQARGEAIDKRVDIWAYGVIVFEMLTGRTLFARSSMAETSAAVLHVEPDYDLLPEKVRHLCRSCLQKDPAHRLRDIGDAQLLIDGPAAGGSPPNRPHRLGWAVAGLFATLAAVAVWAPWRASPSAPQPVRFQITPEATLVVSGASAISPDGRHLAFLATGSDGSIRVWVRDMESLVERVLPDAIVGQAAPPPFWSPDSRFIAFDAGGKLKKIDRSGGLAETIADVPAAVVGGTWNRDGVLVFSGIDKGLFRVSSDGGTPAQVTTVKDDSGNSAHLLPIFLPDGHRFLYFSALRLNPEQAGIFVGSIDRKPEEQDQRRILQTTTSVGYVPGTDSRGTILFLRDGNLMAQAFDETRLELSGPTVQVADGVDAYRDGVIMSVSGNGVLVYRSTANLQLTWMDRQGRPSGKVGDPGRYMALALSGDGARAVVSIADPQVISRTDLWLFDFMRNTVTRFLPTGDDPVWSPDGREVIFDTDVGMYKQAVDGVQPQTLAATSIVGRRAPTSWSPDGRFVLHTFNNLKTSSDIWVMTLSATPTVEPFLETSASESQGQFSPAARQPLVVAYTSNETGRDEIFVRTFPDGGNRKMVSSSGGHSPRWRGDGRELFYVAPDGMVMSVTFTDMGPGTPAPLFAVPAGFASRDATTARAPAPWAVTPDGQRFLFAAPATAARQANGLTVVLNWQAALRWQ